MLYKDAISRAMVEALTHDERVVIIGQNATTPHGVFETLTEAARLFPKRVLEAPLSETMITGACVGLAMEGWKPILVHTRADFALFSFEHLINTAAKFRFLHGKPLPFIMRCVVGHGWGQGPVHSQSWHHLLAQVPGLDVVVATLPRLYGAWVRNALGYGRPTIIFEPRCLYEQDLMDITIRHFDPVDITLLTIGDMILEGCAAAQQLYTLSIRANVQNWEAMGETPQVHGPTLIVDMAPSRPSPGLLAPPFTPLGVAAPYEQTWYITAGDIVEAACKMLGKAAPSREEAVHERDANGITSAF